VTVIIAILSVVALSGTIRAQSQFKFLGIVKETSIKVRQVRNYALANRTVTVGEGDEVEAVIPYKYGACVSEANGTLTLFADMPDSTLNYYDSDNDALLPDGTFTLQEGYKFEVSPDIESANGCDLTLLYEATNARFSVLGDLGGEAISWIQIYEEGEEEGPENAIRSKHIIMFIVAGNPETFNSLTDATDK